MKKLINRMFLGISVVTFAAAFTACSSSDELDASNNPNFDPEKNEVLTQFVFNVSTGNTPTTRMTEAATQAVEVTAAGFRGIDNAVLMTKINTDDGLIIPSAINMDRRFDLSQVSAPGTLDKDNSRRILDMSLPIRTNSLLFYGKAIKGSISSAESTAGLTADDVYGNLEAYNITQDLSNVSIKLAKRLNNGTKAAFDQAEKLISSILTRIIRSGVRGSDHTNINATDNADSDNNYGFNLGLSYPEVSWSDYNNPDNKSPYDGVSALSPIGERLKDAYKNFTTIEPGEMRSGSGSGVMRQIQDLWSIVNGVRCAAPLNEAEAVAKHVAANIHNRLTHYFNGTVPNDGSAVTGVTWKAKDVLIQEILAADNTLAANDFADLSATSLQLSNFPRFFNLPAGSTQLAYVAPTTATSYDQKMVYATQLSASSMGGGAIQAEDYIFPMELSYFGNSAIRVSNQAHKVSEYPQGAHANTGGWDADASWGAEWTANTHVTSETRSVAMKNDINYGTSLLKTTVHYSAAVLKDNNHAIQQRKDATVDEPDKEITVNNTTFQLTGVLVGGQPKILGWDYLYKDGATGNDYKSMVYDRAIPDGAKSIPTYNASLSNESLAPTYTLVADNYKAGGTQDKVYVALEFVNNSGHDFYGWHNLILDGGTFYLIGELDPATVTAPTWPTYHALPPYNANGSSIETPRVFMQDYMTTAHFAIGENSLKYAYNTVPDLRSSNVSLGLSVDLKWSTGLVFENVILGGE